jgi:hypothetical protein
LPDAGSSPESGGIADIPQPPFGADSVEKVLAAVGPNFLRAAGAFYAVTHGGPHQPEQNLSASFFFA